jgi:hypothetical protein
MRTQIPAEYKAPPRFLLFLILFFLLFFPSFAQGQVVIGQYEDEAPYRSWNNLGILTPASSGMGGTAFALASDASAALLNPALLTDLPQFTLTFSGSRSQASFHTYSIVNTGVLFSDQNSSLALYTIDFAGFSMTYKGWALGISIGMLENYDRPSQNVDLEYQGLTYYTIQLQQDGLLRNINISLARKVFERVALGFGVNFVSGDMEKSIVEEYPFDGLTMSDVKSFDYRGLYVNGGLLADITDRMKLGIIFRTPFTKKADSRSEWLYHSSQGNITISNKGSGQSEFKQPLVLGAGSAYRFSREFKAAVDVSYFRWSTYSVDLFENRMKREFKNIIRVSGGFEYMGSFRLFNQEMRMPFRAGLSFDPQPMKELNSYYFYYTIGTGIHWRNFSLDASMILGTEKGSNHDLKGQKLSISLSCHL